MSWLALASSQQGGYNPSAQGLSVWRLDTFFVSPRVSFSVPGSSYQSDLGQ